VYGEQDMGGWVGANFLRGSNLVLGKWGGLK